LIGNGSSGNSPDCPNNMNNAAADIAIVVALPLELAAVLRHLPAGSMDVSVRSIRAHHRCELADGRSVVVACGLGPGQINGALLARDIVSEWRPQLIILTGIAAGIGSGVSLGDVVVSDQIVDYELAKITPEGTRPRWSVYRSSSRLVQRALSVADDRWKNQAAVERPDGAPSSNTRTHVGVVLSGSKVIADMATVEGLSHIWSRALAVEMESAGTAASLWQLLYAPEFIMVKGVCDFADSTKKDDWQPYAADIAASFTVFLLIGDTERQRGREGAGSGDREAGRRVPHRRDKEREPRVSSHGSLVESTRSPLIADIDARGLRFMLTELFDLSELRTLAFDLNVDWENIAGRTKPEKALELIEYMRRRSQLADLLAAINRERPHVAETYHHPELGE
jgi:nucleoside phosphorylase